MAALKFDQAEYSKTMVCKLVTDF